MEANVGNYPENWGVGSFQAFYRLLAACFCQDIEPRLRQPLVKNHKQKGLFATNGMVTTSTFARPNVVSRSTLRQTYSFRTFLGFTALLSFPSHGAELGCHRYAPFA